MEVHYGDEDPKAAAEEWLRALERQPAVLEQVLASPWLLERLLERQAGSNSQSLGAKESSLDALSSPIRNRDTSRPDRDG